MNFLFKKLLLVILIFLLPRINSWATSFTWVGNISSKWDNPSNWTGGTGIPTSSDNITINSCSTTYQLIIDTTVTIANFTMTACTLTINNSYSLNTTGTTIISGSSTLITGAGTFNIGSSSSPVRVNIGVSPGITRGPRILSTSTAYISLASNASYLYGSTWGNCSLNWGGNFDATSNNGGNTFTGTASIGFYGWGGLNFAVTAPDTFQGDVTISNTGIGASFVTLSTNHNTLFDGNVVVVSTIGSNAGIVFGSVSGGGTSNLANGKTITAGTYSGSNLKLYNFTQLGNTSQAIDLTITSNTNVLTIGNSTFNGNFSSTSLNNNIGSSQFYGTASFTRSYAGTGSWDGGNTFYGTATITNSGSGALVLNNIAADVFNSDVSFINYSGSNLLIMNNSSSTGNTYKGNVTMTSNSSAGITISNSATSFFYGNVTANGTTPTNCKFGAGTSLFKGGSNQTIYGPSGGITVSGNLTINKSGASTLSLATPLTVNGVLTLDTGNIITTSSDLLTLNTAATVSGGGTQSFVSGPMAKKGNTAFTYPIGTGSTYAPIGTSSITSSTNTITTQYFNSSPLSLSTSMTSPLHDISNCEYWTLQANSTDSAKVTLSWNSNNCTPINYNVCQIAGRTTGGWSGLGAASITGSCSTGSMITTNKIKIPISSAVESLTFGYNSKVILNTKAVNPTTFIVSGVECFPTGTTFTSSSSGTGAGLVTVHPDLSSNSAIVGIQSGTNNAAENLQIAVNSSGDPSTGGVSSQFQGAYYPMSPSYAHISITGDTVIFSKQKAITPPLAISTNLISGILYDHHRMTSGFQVTVPGFSTIILNIYDLTGGLVYTGTTSWNTSSATPGTYKFQVTVNGTNTYTGQLLYE